MTEQFGAFGARTAEQVEGLRQEFRRQPAFFDETLGREVIGISIGRRLADFNQAFFNAALQIRVGQAERDA